MWQFWLISAHNRLVSEFTNISLNNRWMSTVILPDRKKYALNSRTWICSFCVRALAISALSKPEPEKNIGAFALTFSISLAFKLPTLRDWLAWLEKNSHSSPTLPSFSAYNNKLHWNAPIPVTPLFVLLRDSVPTSGWGQLLVRYLYKEKHPSERKRGMFGMPTTRRRLSLKSAGSRVRR